MSHIKNQNNNKTTSNNNFIEFINHLLTFNKQNELIRKNNKNSLQDLPPFRFNISSKVIIKLSEMVTAIFQKEPNILKITAPLHIFGDIHGQFCDMIRFLEMTGLPPNNKFLFMGDYVDRGNNSIEVVALLFAMKILYPDNIYILRGNHECPEVNLLYGLSMECKSRFDKDSDLVFNKINEALCSLPLCAIINDKIFCVHGGISKNMTKIKEITTINRFCKIPDSGILCDLLWADPASTRERWGNSSRGISHTFNEVAVMEFLKNNNLQLICRAHQLVADGYKFFANNKLITIFSAPNYCGECGNNGAVMKINDNLECSFLIIEPTNKIGG